MVVGPGRTVGERLINDPRLALVSFTGSSEVCCVGCVFGVGLVGLGLGAWGWLVGVGVVAWAQSIVPRQPPMLVHGLCGRSLCVLCVSA
jgi:hypothetical protein